MFERDRVIDAVVPGAPPALKSSRGLEPVAVPAPMPSVTFEPVMEAPMPDTPPPAEMPMAAEPAMSEVPMPATPDAAATEMPMETPAATEPAAPVEATEPVPPAEAAESSDEILVLSGVP